MKAFIKILQSQESGYSGDVPDQRGKYILIPKTASEIFPRLRQTIFNDYKAISIYDIMSNKRFIVKYHWNNAAYHQSLARSRNHDEYRLYRTSQFDRQFNLDRYVITVFIPLAEDGNDFVLFSFNNTANNAEYQYLKNLIHNVSNNRSGTNITINLLDYQTLHNSIINKLISDVNSYQASRPLGIEIENLEEFPLSTNAPTTNSNQLKNPLEPFIDVFKNQSDFTNTVRRLYNNKCAIRKTSLIENSPVGLDSAHIHPRAHRGSWLPNNGILMSKDLHSAFDSGYFTIDDDYNVLVHDSVARSSLIWTFNQTKITELSNSIYQPFKPYLEHHRLHVFGTFSQIRSL